MVAAVNRKAPRPHPLIPQSVCACGKSIAWLARPGGKRVPADPRAGCFIVLGGRDESTGEPAARGVALAELYENVESLKLRDGREIPIERVLAILPNHFANCAIAGRHRQVDRRLAEAS